MFRLLFVILYYIVNCIFVGSVFTIEITFPMMLICCYNLFKIRSDRITVGDMLWLTAYLFFVIGPIQALHDFYFVNGPVDGVKFAASDILTGMAIVVVFFLSVTAVIEFGRVQKSHTSNRAPTEANFAIGDTAAILIFGINLVAFIMAVVWAGGLGGLEAPRTEHVSAVSKGIGFMSVVFAGLQIITSMLLGAKFMRTRGPRFILGLMFGIAVLLLAASQNPFNTARFGLIAAWLPLMLMFAPPLRKAPIFYSCCFFGLIVIMPILNYTSRYGYSISQAFQQIDVAKYVFRLPFIDVFDTLCFSVVFLKHMDPFYGMKTLGIMLFFIPRSIWTAKASILALDLGQVLVDLKYAGTANLSYFLGGEFYADFRLFGVCIGATLFALLIYLVFGRTRRLIMGLPLFEYIGIASVPILMRGPFGAVIGLSFSEVVGLFLILRFLCWRTSAISAPAPAAPAPAAGRIGAPVRHPSLPSRF